MKRAKKRRKSSVNEAHLMMIAIVTVRFIITIKQILIVINTSLANFPSTIQLLLILFVAVTVASFLFLRLKYKNFRYNNRHRLLSSMDYMKLSDYEFEKFCAEVLNRLGYKVKVTRKTNDGGKDLIGINPNNQKLFDECKQWNTNVGRPYLQKLKGAMCDANVNYGIFITTSGFSKPALEYASRNNIKCIDRTELNKLIAKADKLFYKSKTKL